MRPTHVRYLIVAVAMLAAVLLYLERVCLSVAEVFIREDLHLSRERMNLVLGAFFWAYALGQVPAGWLSQRYGPRAMMSLYLLGWSVFGVFIALAQDFWTLFLARFLLGLSQAGAYPTAALLVKRWVPDRGRGLANAVVAFGGRFGGAGANWLTGVLIVAFVPFSIPATVTPDDVLSRSQFLRLNQHEPAYLAQLDPGEGPYRPVWVRVVCEFRERGINRDSYPAPEAAAAAVNTAIEDPSLTDGVDWSRVTLSKDGQKILAKPPAERTQAESERLNRLVIEKAFPGAIRQLHGQGWRPTLLTYGLLGILVGAVFWLVARDWPRNHPWANAQEVALIESGQSPTSQRAGSSAVPWRELIASRNQWLFSVNQFFSNVGWVFLITLMPRFLDERFHVPVDQRGLMTTIPLFVAAFGMLAGGWYTDRTTRTLGRRWGRAIPMGAFKFPCAAVLAVSPWLPDPWTVVVTLTVMSACTDFGNPAVWAFAQDTGGRQAATVLGWANMWGNLGAGIGSVLVGDVAARFGWDAALYTGAGAFVVCGVAGMLTNAAEPLFCPDEANP